MGRPSLVLLLIIVPCAVPSIAAAEEVRPPLLYAIDHTPSVTVNGAPVRAWKKAPDYADDFAQYVLELPSAGFAQIDLRSKSGVDYRIAAVLLPGVVFEWLPEEGLVPVRVLPGARCGLVPRSHGLEWFKCQAEEPLRAGHVFSLDECPRPAMDFTHSVWTRGSDGGGATLIFLATAPGLYRFALKSGALVATHDEKTTCNAEGASSRRHGD